METKELTDSQKLQYIQDSRKIRNKWNKLSREEKLKILEGMDIATDEKWILTLFKELKNED